MLEENARIGIVVQARYASTRLPGKLFKTFYHSKKMIEVFLESLQAAINKQYSITIATTNNPKDDLFEEIASDFNIKIFRGDEHDVLKRIIDASKESGYSTIIRVCADNPIYDIRGTLELLKKHFINNADYTAYYLEGGLPSIKSHLGLWGEVVELKALEIVNRLAHEEVYHEHVTNFIYANQDKFNVRLIEAIPICFKRKDLRFTVDDVYDFKLMQEIYLILLNNYQGFSVEKLIEIVENNPNFLKRMALQIKKYKK